MPKLHSQWRQRHVPNPAVIRHRDTRDATPPYLNGKMESPTRLRGAAGAATV